MFFYYQTRSVGRPVQNPPIMIGIQLSFSLYYHIQTAIQPHLTCFNWNRQLELGNQGTFLTHEFDEDTNMITLTKLLHQRR